MYTPTIIVALLGAFTMAQSISSAPPTTAPAATPTCTHLVSEKMPWGCTITAASATTTESIDCKGCVISTTQIANGFFGHGPVCFNGRKTVQDAKVTATVQACSL